MSAFAASGATIDLDRLIALAGHAKLHDETSRASAEAGDLSGPRRGEGGNLFDLRPFQDGDDPRRIDPAATARSGRVQVRNRHEEVERTLVLVADFRGPMLWGTRGRFRSVAAAEALALEGWSAISNGGRIGAVIARDGAVERLAPRPGTAAMLAVCGAFAAHHDAALSKRATDCEPLDRLLDGVADDLRPGTGVTLASGLDDPGEGFDLSANALSRRCRLQVLLVLDAVQVEPPSGTYPVRIGGRAVRGRFGRLEATARLDGLGIETRIVNAAAPAIWETAS